MSRIASHLARRLPSPAMGVALVALLAALAGSAVALPGSNSVTSGDIANGAVKTQDIRNSTVRGRDVRNDSLTGSDVSESSLGTVPRAGTANSAGGANTAGAAAFAGSAATAGATTGIFRSAQIRALDDDDIPIATLSGFRLRLRCDLDSLATLSGDQAEIVLENVSAGDDAHFDADNHDDQNLDQGEEEDVLSESGDDTQRTVLAAAGANGSLSATLSVTASPDEGFDTADCLAHVFAGTSR